MTTRPIMLTTVALLLAYAAVTTISPTLFGAPPAVRVAINLAATVVIIIGIIALIKDMLE